MQQTNPVDYYQIYRSIDSSSSTNYFPLHKFDQSLNDTTTYTYTDSSNLDVSHNYYYAISAVNDVSGVLYISSLVYSSPLYVTMYSAGTPTNFVASTLTAYDPITYPADVSSDPSLLSPAVYLSWDNDTTNVDISYNVLHIINNSTDSSYNVSVYDNTYYIDASNIDISNNYTYTYVLTYYMDPSVKL